MSTRIDDGLLVIDTRVADGKAAVIAGDTVALAVDAGIDDVEGQSVLDAARSLGRPTVQLIYTHGHIDHALGGTAFRGLGIIGTPGISEHMAAQVDAWAARLGEHADALEDRLGWPTLMAADEDELDLGGRRIRVIDAPGHAPGTICVFDPDAGVLFGGDTIVTNIPPAFSDGDSRTLEDTMRRLAGLEVATLVPGHGEVVRGTVATRDAILWSADYLARCRDHVRSHAGSDAETIVAAAPYDDFVGDHLERERFRNEWRHEQTIRRMLVEEGSAQN